MEQRWGPSSWSMLPKLCSLEFLPSLKWWVCLEAKGPGMSGSNNIHISKQRHNSNRDFQAFPSATRTLRSGLSTQSYFNERVTSTLAPPPSSQHTLFPEPAFFHVLLVRPWSSPALKSFLGSYLARAETIGVKSSH